MLLTFRDNCRTIEHPSSHTRCYQWPLHLPMRPQSDTSEPTQLHSTPLTRIMRSLSNHESPYAFLGHLEMTIEHHCEVLLSLGILFAIAKPSTYGYIVIENRDAVHNGQGRTSMHRDSGASHHGHTVRKQTVLGEIHTCLRRLVYGETCPPGWPTMWPSLDRSRASLNRDFDALELQPELSNVCNKITIG